MGLLNELGIWTIQTIIQYKKLLYLHKLVHYPESYIAKQVLLAQIEKPGPTWWNSILQIGQEIGQEINLENISKISKYSWKKQIKEKLQNYHLKNLKNWTITSKKCKNMNPKGKIQDYLIHLNRDEARAILLERLGMTKVRSNYKNMFNSTICQKCNVEEETTIHLIKCQLDGVPIFIPCGFNLHTLR